jgi:hypothetical protein
MNSKYKHYVKPNTQAMRPYEVGEVLNSNISISIPDKENGSPKAGDMIAVNSNNPEDKWLVSAEFFKENYVEDRYANVEDRDLTFGEKAVGRRFNPSGSDEVDQCKLMYAKVIDQMNDMRSGPDMISHGKARHASTAITMAEDAQMRAVKAITWRD